MIGIQVFNYPNDYKFFKEETVEFNYRWLTEFLKITPEEITFTEDIWAGGGNMGPSIEYFVGGLEVGNMVFMQYKTFHDGTYEELPVKVIDTGIGLERVAWVVNGDSTSYMSTFKNAMEYLTKELEMKVDNDVWAKLGPLSCQLDVDECENLQQTWDEIGKELGLSREDISKAIEPIKDLIVILDHTRSSFFLIRDGSLPSNVGGGSNLRNIIRRSFALMKKHGWWEKIGFEGYLGIFEAHKKDLEGLYGKFNKYESFADIMRNEYDRWLTTDDVQKQKLKKFAKKKKTLTLEDWETAVTAWGISPDVISHFLKTPIPDNLYYYIAEKQERIVKAPEQILFNTLHLPETVCLYYDHNHNQWAEGEDMYNFSAKILEVFLDVRDNNRRNIIVLDRSGFYPTSGGQANDAGTLTIAGKVYHVDNVEKVGKVSMHITREDLPESIEAGTEVKGQIDEKRRVQLRNHHTAAHIIFTSCRKVLGPHVWQSGAKKTVKQAHLDITHFKSLSKEQEMLIQNEANRIVMGAHYIKKDVRPKSETEKEYGFALYQGGVVPGNELRVVQIGDDVDIEACCGTHCDSTSEVGWIKLLSSKTIANGVVRLYFVAGERSVQALNTETTIINELTDLWSIAPDQITETAQRFFKDFKKYKNNFSEAQKKILGLQVRLSMSNEKPQVYSSDEPNGTLYFSFLPEHAKGLVDNKKSVAFLGKTFLIAFGPSKGSIDVAKLKEALKDTDAKVVMKNKVGSKKKQVKNVEFVSVISKTPLVDLRPVLEGMGFEFSSD
jgi:alanyl-tRNA synthetase